MSGPAALPLLLLLFLLLVPSLLAAHVVLESSAPARNDVIDSLPAALRLQFSGRIEARYTTVELVAPNGDLVQLGPVTFVAGSDRAFTVGVAPATLPGTYTVRWRTAGSDGHVLEGSYSFRLAADTAAARADARVAAPVEDVHDHGATGATASTTPAQVLGRWLHLAALTLLLGGVTFRAAVLPSLAVAAAERARLVVRLWRLIATATLLLLGAALLRLWLQSAALHGAERAWSSALLSIMLTDTGWGRAWLLQAALLGALAVTLVLAQPGRDGAALRVATAVAFCLGAIPGLSGHAAGSIPVVINDTLHVLAAGAWLGTLAALALVVVPRLLQSPAGATAVGDAVRAFSPVAMVAGGVIVLTGVINALLHIGGPADLLETRYGLTLLVKLLGVVLLFGAGFYHWRFVRPRLGDGDAVARFRLSSAGELLLAVLVLLATAVLTGLPRP